MSLKASSVIISLASARHSDFRNSISLRTYCDSTFVWTISANASLCKRIDRN